VSSICHGLWVCVSAGILKGRTATCFFAVKDDVINAGAKYVDQEVVVDGNLITSRKPDDLPAFMRETLKAIAAGPGNGNESPRRRRSKIETP
jgi:protease I